MGVPTDPRYAEQLHLRMIGDIEKVWNDYTGAGVRVIVYDDGIEYTHEDLAPNYNASAHFTIVGSTFDARPNSLWDGHGTAVAGIIAAAANNEIGTVGVAYGATLTGVDFLNEVQFSVYSDAGLRYARFFDVMNNSFGRLPLYESSNNLNVSSSESSKMVAAYFNVTSYGRGGLGTVIVQAAGNEGGNRYPGILGNANGDGVNTSRFTATIAATELSGWSADYSNWGSSVLIAAPAENLTTDMTGSAGYDPGNYVSDFNGTSAATPVVSGVVALMLEANDHLGWRDVQNILAISAAHTGSDIGTPGGGDEVGGWIVNGATTWNGGGLTSHLSYGFGLVDAYAAVRMAEVWTDMHPAPATSANELHWHFDGFGVTIADLRTVRTGIDAVENILIEDITVTIDMYHSWVSDLRISLEAPNGTIFELFRNELGGNDFDGTWSFGVTGALGMESMGTWTLVVEDQVAGDSGYVYGWSLDFYGSAVRPGDVYHFTDDFLYYRAHDASRGVIRDTDGGYDWLNLAAITGAVTIDMAPGGSLSVAGAHWADIAPGTVVENIVTGDGNDDITGNNSPNVIRAMRGNDTIRALGGNDQIYGGTGFDTIWAGSGNDTVWGDDGRDRVWLEAGDDVFHDNDQTGDFAADTVSGGDGNDSIYGAGGNDVLAGDDGYDLIHGGDGDDLIYGGNQYDTIHGGDGNDQVWGGNGRDEVYLGAGDDVFNDNDQFGHDGADYVDGGDGADTINGGGGDDTFLGGAGDDLIVGGDGNDLIHGGDGDDRIYAGNQYDTVYAGAGNDSVWGGNGRDEIFLEDGDDVFFDNAQGGIDGADYVSGGIGNDTLNGGGGRDTLLGDGGHDVIYGGAGEDLIFGGSGNDLIYDGSEYDVVHAGSGSDTVYGGNGRDVFYLDEGNDLFIDNDQTGIHAADTIYGGAGNDTIIAAGGDDYIDGGTGNDLLTGGVGVDTFVFREDFGLDRITDFDVTEDRLHFDSALWGGTDYSEAELIDTFASMSGDRVLFDFDGNILTILDISSTMDLTGTIYIV